MKDSFKVRFLTPNNNNRKKAMREQMGEVLEQCNELTNLKYTKKIIDDKTHLRKKFKNKLTPYEEKADFLEGRI